MGATDTVILSKTTEKNFEIITDKYGVNHVLALSDNDAYFGMGFAHAADRLFQMEMFRRTAAGELASIIGEQGIFSDTFFTRLGINDLAIQDTVKLDDHSNKQFNSYIAGINAYIDSVKKLPPEFYALGIKPKEWQIKDTMLLIRLLSFSFSPSWHTKLFRLDIAQSFKDNAHLLDPTFSLNSLNDLSEFTDLINESIHNFKDAYNVNNHHLSTYPKISGSNAWAVNGELSKSGKPLLASDPHLEPSATGMLHAIHVKGATINAIGTGIPGIPGVFIGHNDYYAWGVTAGLANTSECILTKVVQYKGNDFIDTIDPKNEIIKKKKIIKVKMMPDQEIEYFENKYGSLIEIGNDSSNKKFAVIVYCSSVLQNNLWDISSKVWTASSYQEINEIINNWQGASLNFVYATIDNHIGQKLVGNILEGNDTLEQMFPLNYMPTQDLTFYKVSDLPSEVHTKDKYVVSANSNPINDLNYGADWAEKWRSVKISELLKDQIHDIESFKSIQLNQESTAMKLLSEMICNILQNDLIKQFGNNDFMNIKNWDGNLSADSKTAFFIQEMYFELSKSILDHYMEDKSAELMGEFRFFNHTSASLSYRLQGWLLYILNEIQYKRISFSNIEALLRNALNKVTSKHSNKNLKEKTWGSNHFLYISHILSNIKILGKLWPSNKYSFGGDSNTINQAGYMLSNQSKILWAPVYRQIIDLSDFDSSVFQIINGNSGLPDSIFYNDSMQEYLDGEYRPLIFSINKIHQNTHAKIQFNVV
ncbi:MAG: penicillin acylase family protein [Dehalococcoidia bacterium]|nr:penicillin acylase family protein [Dehalococcoidia bacterium]